MTINQIKTEMTTLVYFSKTLKVLYVEDNKDARIQTVKMLNNFFTNITIGVNGEDGLEKFQEDEYDLIISDINMPKKSGIDMLKEIKELNSEVYCLIISAHNETDFFIDAIELGIDGFLLKPIRSNQFSTLILKTIKKIKNSQEIKQLNKKQAKLSSLGEMMDAIAHQWKQPLSLITTIASSLPMKINSNMEITNDEIKRNSFKIMEQANHIVETLDDFRSFFRPNIIKKEISAKHLIYSVLNLMNITLMKEKIKIIVICDEIIKIDVIASEFKHVFINLINNSKDAYLTLNNDVPRVINIDVFKNENNKVIIEFKDKAGGISPNFIDKIFDLHFTTKKNANGTGIGLNMTKQIVEKIGGSIVVNNNNSGVCFRIELIPKDVENIKI